MSLRLVIIAFVSLGISVAPSHAASVLPTLGGAKETVASRARKVHGDIKKGMVEVFHKPDWLGATNLLKKAEESRLRRDIQRNFSHAMLPLLARVFDILPSGYSNADLYADFGITAAVSISTALAVDRWFRGKQRSYWPGRIGSSQWRYFGSETPIGEFFRGAYGGVGIATAALGIVLPVISGGGQINPIPAAEIVGLTGLSLGTLKAIGKALENREIFDQGWPELMGFRQGSSQ